MTVHYSAQALGGIGFIIESKSHSQGCSQLIMQAQGGHALTGPGVSSIVALIDAYLAGLAPGKGDLLLKSVNALGVQVGRQFVAISALDADVPNLAGQFANAVRAAGAVVRS